MMSPPAAIFRGTGKPALRAVLLATDEAAYLTDAAVMIDSRVSLQDQP
ncbi:MAG: hypothetical protein LAT78_02780 [Roseinatronobacter sp.]|jgi:hypothetical protein|nr:hypothetical protein [Roseinatronobacter sp.]